jgi:selenocysteine lyase/cysteine desulfurase
VTGGRRFARRPPLPPRKRLIAMRHSPKPSDWTRWRAEFPIARRYVYMNHAAVSPLSPRVVEAMNRIERGFLEKGVLCEDWVFPRVDEARRAAARLVGARPGEIAFTRNTTNGVLIAANGIRWRRGDNVVMPSIEFPANAYPWIALEKRGVRVRLVEPREGRVTAEMLMRACTRRTRAVTASLVQFSNGYRIDAAALGSFCRERGIYFHADAIQSLGALRCDVGAMKIDFLSTGGHKWLLGPAGAGFFYCRGDLLDELDVWNPGWLGVENAWDYLNFRQGPRPDAARFDEGTRNLYGISGLGASIERFLEIGTANVERRILALTDYIDRGLSERGCRITSPRRRGERSGILCFVHPRDESAKLFEKVLTKRIVLSLRQGAIRFSPHFYNTEAEADRILDLIPRA